MNIKQVHYVPGNSTDFVIGKPLCSPEEMGMENPLATEERFIPRLLVQAGVVKSTGEVKRNRPDLFVAFPDDHQGFYTIKMGRRHLCFLVGAKA